MATPALGEDVERRLALGEQLFPQRQVIGEAEVEPARRRKAPRRLDAQGWGAAPQPGVASPQRPLAAALPGTRCNPAGWRGPGRRNKLVPAQG